MHNSELSERRDIATPFVIVCNLQFAEAMHVDPDRDGKLRGGWDTISWAPLVGVGSALVALIDDLALDQGSIALTERLPYTQPGRTDVTIGNDIALSPGDPLAADMQPTLQAGCIDFSQQVLNHGDANNLTMDYVGCLTDHQREIIRNHVDRFRRTWGSRKIQEAFVCKIGETSILFAKCFCPKLIPSSGPEMEMEVVAKIEGAERKNHRVRCTLVLLTDQSQRTVHFEDNDLLLMEVHRRLWDSGYYHMQVLESDTASGDRTWSLVRIDGCAQSGTPLFPPDD